MTTKRKICLALALAASGMTLLGTTAQAGGDGPFGRRECRPEMLRGLYLFKGTGFNPVNGVAVPKAIIETIRFNGDGTLVAETVTLTVLGQSPVRREGTGGTYTVDANCTGTITFSDGPGFDIYVSSALFISLIQTAPIPAVLQGDARYVAR